jgi:hypothetical protein
MSKGLVFATLEDFEARNVIITEAIKAKGVECEQYALSLECEGGYFMQIADGYEDNFSIEELENQVDYLPLQK